MRYIVIIFFLLLACKEDEPTPQPQTDKGCQSGRTASGNWVFIRCCTEAQHQAGSNTAQGGIAAFSYYTDHKWEKCAECQ